jgi:hypothetical protein
VSYESHSKTAENKEDSDMLMDRIMGVFRLNVSTFEEIEADQNATSQAAIVVLIVALISAVGSGLAANLTDDSTFLNSFLSTLIGTFIGWFVWSVITYFVGTSLFGGTADLSEMLRVIGFAYAPQILGIIPCIGAIIGFIWSLVAGVIAVRQGLDLDNTKALFTIIIGFIGYLAVLFVLGLILGGGALAIGALTGG